MGEVIQEPAVVETGDPNPALRTQRLRLEPLVPRHATVLYTRLRDPRLYTYIPQEPPPSPAALAARYTQLAARRAPDKSEVWLNWAVQRHDTAAYVGVVEATVYAESTAALAYLIFVPWWRQGYATEACACVLRHLYDTCAVTRVVADIDTRNVASCALVASLGFVQIALTRQADVFKGASSDEYRYEHTVRQHTDVRAARG